MITPDCVVTEGAGATAVGLGIFAVVDGAAVVWAAVAVGEAVVALGVVGAGAADVGVVEVAGVLDVVVDEQPVIRIAQTIKITRGIANLFNLTLLIGILKLQLNEDLNAGSKVSR